MIDLKKVLIFASGAAVAIFVMKELEKRKLQKSETNVDTIPPVEKLDCTGAEDCKDFKCPDGYTAEWGKGVQMSANCIPNKCIEELNNKLSVMRFDSEQAMLDFQTSFIRDCINKA